MPATKEPREEPLSCVLLADRHHGLTEGVRGLLETVFRSVVMVADEASLLEGAVRLRPEVAIVDLSLARDGDLGWLRTLRQRCPDLKVVALSVHDEQSVRRAAMEAGADAVVLKRAIATDLLAAVDSLRPGCKGDSLPSKSGATARAEGQVGK
ncbi:MAG: response regulator transcription factor [Thermoanaerobaculales bacterium]|jgi:two-component system secretion response regulator SsrB|nr:response regulator transcription factor [Thermoanaerobaculales bacterium]